jgi:hypothetical protein
MNFVRVKELLAKTHWANKRIEEKIQKSMENSLCYGVVCVYKRKEIYYLKKVIIMILLLSIIALLILIYNKMNNYSDLPNFSLDINGDYTGFSNLPTNYTIQKAKYDGYLVTQNLAVVANENVWNIFFEASMRKENTGVRIVQFYTDSVEDPFFIDLFYNDGYYYLFDSSSINQEKQPLLYLLKLDGSYGNPVRDSGVIVLANDDTLTFDMVMKALSSSSTEVINSIPAFKIVMFK